MELIKHIFLYHPEAPLMFNSFLFMFLFVFVLSIYAAIYRNRLSRTLFLFVFSLFFYYKTSGIFVLLLLGTLVATYWLVKWMNHQENGKRKWILSIVILLIIGILGYFKYANFAYENVCALLKHEYHPLDIFLPVGISFYSFQLLSYAIDVYRKDLKEEASFWNYAFYITFFPQLVAGPIVRAKDFLPQLRKSVNIKVTEIEKGFFLIMQGLFKKAVADYLAQYNDLVFGNPAGYSGVEALMAILGYTIQIYCDFSGYTDMAIGMAKMMGFDLGINFNKPYQSVSITDFWRRWHISLSSWLRDYLYIPLGGNRKGRFRTYLNLMVTMLIGGLWHGANWKFVFWGGMHGVGLVLDKLWRRITGGRMEQLFWGRLVGWLSTLVFVSALWVFFRADSFSDALLLLRQCGSGYSWPMLVAFVQTRPLFVILMLVMIAIHAIPSSQFHKVENLYIRTPFIVKAIVFILLIQCILQLQTEEVQPFIYFQF